MGVIGNSGAKGKFDVEVAKLVMIKRAFSPGEFDLPRTQATKNSKAKMDLTRIQRISIRDEGTRMDMGRPNVTTAIWTGATSQYENMYTVGYSPKKVVTDPVCKNNCAYSEGKWFVIIVPDHLFTEIVTKMRFDPLVFFAQLGGILGIIMGCLKAIKNTTLFVGKRRCIWCCHDRLALRQDAVLDALKKRRA